MKLIWYTVLIRAIPEAIGLVLLTLAIAKEKRNTKDIMLVSLICAAVAFTMRMLPLKFGIHMLLVVVINAIIMNVILKTKLQKAFLGVLVSMAILSFAEIATFMFIGNVLKIGIEEMHSNAFNTVISGIPSLLILYLTSFAITKFNYRNGLKEAPNYVNQ